MVTRKDFVVSTNPSGFTLRWKHNHRAIKTFIIHPDKVVDGTIKASGIGYETQLLLQAKNYSLDIVDAYKRNDTSQSMLDAFRLFESPDLTNRKYVRDVGVVVPDNYRCDDRRFLELIIFGCQLSGGKYKDAGDRLLAELNKGGV